MNDEVGFGFCTDEHKEARLKSVTADEDLVGVRLSKFDIFFFSVQFCVYDSRYVTDEKKQTQTHKTDKRRVKYTEVSTVVGEN